MVKGGFRKDKPVNWSFCGPYRPTGLCTFRFVVRKCLSLTKDDFAAALRKAQFRRRSSQLNLNYCGFDLR